MNSYTVTDKVAIDQYPFLVQPVQSVLRIHQAATLYVHEIVQDVEQLLIIIDPAINVTCIIEGRSNISYLHVRCGNNSEATLYLQHTISATVLADMHEPGGQLRIRGWFYLREQESCKLTTVQYHRAPHTSTDLYIKGIAADNSAAEYHGTIIIEAEAHQAHASQNNAVLLLDPTARARAQPNLEVKTDNVQCKHGSAIGQLNQEQVWYMMARGITETVARDLLIEGFLTEVKPNSGVTHEY